MTPDRITANQYIRAALTIARTVSGREIVFQEDGITVIDPLGGKHTYASSVPMPPKNEFISILEHEFRSFNSKRSEIEISGHGKWVVNDKSGSIALKTAKPRFAALEAVIKAAPDQLAMMRSLYGQTGVDIVVACEGETRAKDIALAFATELTLSGRNAKLRLNLEHHYKRDRTLETAIDQEGPEIFSGTNEDGPTWIVEQPEGKVDMSKLDTPGADVSRVVVWVDEQMASRFSHATEGAFAPSRRPGIIVGVRLMDSEAVGKLVFSRKANSLATAEELVENAPWTTHNARKAARSEARPQAPKTWHQTTEAVARAFIERKAPRGYVSGKSLYFHGPVAYSLYDKNPVAAFVDLPDGRTILFTGRQTGQGGTLAGTVSSAKGDIDQTVNSTNLLRFRIDEVTDFLSLGGLKLDEMAWGFRRHKNEKDYPSSCTVDIAKLESYIVKRRRMAEESHVKKTKVATYAYSGYLGDLAALAEFRDAMCDLLKIELPHMGDAADLRQKQKEERLAAQQRQANLEKRRREEAEKVAQDDHRGFRF